MCFPLAPIWVAISSFLSSIFTWFNQFDTIDSALFLVSFPPYCWGCSFFGYLPLIPLPWSHSVLNTLLERFSSLIHCPGLIYNSSKSALCVSWTPGLCFQWPMGHLCALSHEHLKVSSKGIFQCCSRPLLSRCSWSPSPVDSSFSISVTTHCYCLHLVALPLTCLCWPSFL